MFTTKSSSERFRPYNFDRCIHRQMKKHMETCHFQWVYAHKNHQVGQNLSIYGCWRVSHHFSGPGLLGRLPKDYAPRSELDRGNLAPWAEGTWRCYVVMRSSHVIIYDCFTPCQSISCRWVSMTLLGVAVLPVAVSVFALPAVGHCHCRHCSCCRCSQWHCDAQLSVVRSFYQSGARSVAFDLHVRPIRSTIIEGCAFGFFLVE